MQQNQKDVVLSGIRATGKMHLGNYLGALKYFAELSNDPTKKNYFFIANLHTLTTKTDPDLIKRDLLNIVIDFISVGINMESSVIFAQSSVPETSELNWLLNCITSVAELERMPHFKDKKGQKEELGEIINAGLLTYPVLMAADILGPSATLVPVGEDQHPHVELARTIAKRFNYLYGETFSIPNLLESDPVRVPGLDGTGKMGKSDNNTIDLSDSEKVVTRKILQAVTDPARARRSDPGDPKVCKVYSLHELMSSNEELSFVYSGCKKASIGCVDCKRILIKNVMEILEPIQAKKAEIISNKNYTAFDILHEGGKTARAIIAEKVLEVKDKMGVPKY